MDQGCYTLISRSPTDKTYTEAQMKADLENASVPIKTAALKELIKMYANGEKIHNILMTVIRFVMPCQDHLIKKLLFVFWEIFPRYGPDGKLLQEMILVCDNYRKDLQHPNEYIRGCTLRFLCKIKEAELLEPLMPTIQACLDHRHPYVRRNAVLAIYTIYKNFDFLIPDAPEKMLNYLQQEQDASCRRNAFIMLTHVSQPLAFEYLIKCIDEVPNFDDILQLVVVELIYKFCHKNPNEKTRFIRCVYGLLQSNSPSVRYEAAGTLITLSNAPTAVKAVANCYINLIIKENDNNVKLIVMDRLMAMRLFNERVIQDMIMEIVAILNSSDFELREKTLEFISDLATNRTVNDMVDILLKELTKSCIQAASASNTNGEVDKNDTEARYRYCLVRTIFEISNRFPDILPLVIPSLCQTLTYTEVANSEAAYETCRFLRHSAQKHAANRPIMVQQLTNFLPQITGNRTLKFSLWLLGEFCKSLEEIENFMNLIPQILGDLPLVENELKRISGDSNNADEILLSNEPQVRTTTKLTADGTYATESALVTKSTKPKNISRPNLQSLLFEGEFLPGVTLVVTLVKLFLKQSKNFEEEKSKEQSLQRKNSMAAECMLIISSLIRLGMNKCNLLQNAVNPDLIDRLWMCFRLLNDSNRQVLGEFYESSILRLDEMLDSQESERRVAANIRKATGSFANQKKIHEQEKNRLDGPIEFSLLNSGKGNWLEGGDRFEMTLMQALGSDTEKNLDLLNSSNLDKVHQLTGSSDPVYAEAYVNINQFDIILDILLVNMTSDTLQNLTIELSTLGDLKLVERPQPITLAAEDFTNIKASIKVSSTENGVIFGNIVYDLRGSSGESTCIIMSNINIDILEYIRPSTCTPAEYRDMWSEFEWENKVTVNTQISNLHAYLAHIVKSTNFNCLTPPEAMDGICDYLCVTLYAKSIFGENVLANLCLEKSAPISPVSGHIRIRAKTQGMAVNIGDKISQAQKLPISPELVKELKTRGIVLEATSVASSDIPQQEDSVVDRAIDNSFVDCVA